MTIEDLKDFIFRHFPNLRQKLAGIDNKFYLELDEESWNKFQKDIKEATVGYIPVLQNGEVATIEQINEVIFDSIVIPYVGEFEIVKSDKFSLTLKED